MNDNFNSNKINILIISSLLNEKDEEELNDNENIKISIIPISNFSSEEIFKFLVEVSEKLPVTIVCALLKEALIKIVRKKIKPEPNKISITIKEVENEKSYTVVSDFPISEESVNSIIDRTLPKNNTRDE